MNLTHKEYLGDAVEAGFDGYHIWLYTQDGNNQCIALEPAVFDALLRYRERLYAEFAKQQEESQ